MTFWASPPQPAAHCECVKRLGRSQASAQQRCLSGGVRGSGLHQEVSIVVPMMPLSHNLSQAICCSICEPSVGPGKVSKVPPHTLQKQHGDHRLQRSSKMTTSGMCGECICFGLTKPLSEEDDSGSRLLVR